MMLVETDYLLVKYEPEIGGLIRQILITNQRLIAPAAGKRRQWQNKSKVCRIIVLNWPDPPDEGATGRFRYSVDGMIRQMEKAGASVEARGKVA